MKRFVTTSALGFTLIELMIVVAIMGILASIAIPAYSDYTRKAKLTEAFSSLLSTQAKLEQYYQDNRRYASASAGSSCGVAMPTGLKDFTLSCTATDTSSAQTFTLTATGAGTMSSFVYTLDHNTTKTTTGSYWGVTSSACWVSSKGGGCY